MTFRIAGDRLKIALTAQDVELLGLNLKRQDAASLRQLKRALLRLLLDSGCAPGLFADARLIRMEVRPDEEGGCTVCCRADDRPADAAAGDPMIYAFDDAEDMIEAAVRLFSLHGHRICQSALYPGDPGYRLVVYPLDGPRGRVAALLSEYGRRLPGGALAAAVLEEHFSPILPERAVDTLCYHFSR